MPDQFSDQGGLRRFHYRKNAYGGWEVVDEFGCRAPRPHSFNQARKAAERSEALNAETARALDEQGVTVSGECPEHGWMGRVAGFPGPCPQCWAASRATEATDG